jgi:N,N'-diacetyllegionaminate synthase
MRIDQREIGLEHPPYVIAEIGVNHDGELERALSLTDAAADAGADAVKLQFFETDRLMSSAAKLAAYQKNAGETDPIEMLRRLELTIDEMAQVVDRAHERGIHAIVTVFSTELVEIAETLAWDAYKTASPDIVNRPLLEALAKTGKPMIVSTGAANFDELPIAESAIWKGNVVGFLQCVSCYPTKPIDASIGGVYCIADEYLRFWNAPEVYGNGPVAGYSDHTTALDTGALAVRVGACILEKHLTYSTDASGPDHAASLTADQFAEYVELARNQTMGPLQTQIFDIAQSKKVSSTASVTSAKSPASPS